MFYGLYEYSLDNKGRLCIPKKFKDETNGKLYIMKGYDGALALYDSEAFEKLITYASNLPFNKKDARDFLRVQLSSACELEIDSHGRILIPSLLINKYNIASKVVMIGVGDHIEIWNKDLYLKYEEDVNNNFEEIAENLIKVENHD